MALTRPEHYEWPNAARSAYAAARCLAYLMVAVAGLDVAYGPVDGDRQSAHLFIDVIGNLAAVSGFAGTIGTIYRRWMVEWVAVAAMTGVLVVYSILDWTVKLFVDGYPPLPIAATAILGGAATVAAVATGGTRWRVVALAAVVAVLIVAVPLDASNAAIITAATAMIAGRMVELWLFADAAVRARRLRPGDIGISP